MRTQAFLSTLTGALLASSAFAADVTLSRPPVRVATPAPVISLLSGDVSMYGGAVSYEPCCGSEGIFGGEGRFAWGLGSSMVLQGDVGGETLFDNGNGWSQFGLTGHLYNRGMGGALGVKAGVGNSEPFMSYMFGVEGHLYMGGITLGAEINNTWYSLIEESAVQVRGLARVYIDPNTRIQLDASWWTGDVVDNNTWAFGASAAHRLMGTPIDLNAGLRYDSDEVGHSFRGTVGLTFNFDMPGTTKMGHDRNNVVFDKFDLLRLQEK